MLQPEGLKRPHREFRVVACRDSGFRDLGFRDLGFRDLGFRDLGFRDLGFANGPRSFEDGPAKVTRTLRRGGGV